MRKAYRIISIEAADIYRQEQENGGSVGYKMPESKSDAYSNNLSKDFVSRLNANIDKRDLYRVNEITYMLIQTLSGKERIELIGFIEDR